MLVSKNLSSGHTLFSINIAPVSVGLYRLMLNIEASCKLMKKNFGFSESDLDDIKSIFTQTSLTMLALTYVITILHVVFDFLAFKNDYGFWKGREDLAGLSR